MSEADQEWKPSGRPTSTMAQAFSATLDSVFSLDSDVDQLSQNIDHKRQQMIIQNRELEALQQKIREAEERLKSREIGAASEGGNNSKNSTQQDSTSRSVTPSRTERAARFFTRDDQRGAREQANTNSS